MRLLRLSIFALALLAVIVVLSACGKRGDPVPPGEEREEKSLF